MTMNNKALGDLLHLREGRIRAGEVLVKNGKKVNV